jgi:hypothetical protein
MRFFHDFLLLRKDSSKNYQEIRKYGEKDQEASYQWSMVNCECE